MDTAGAPRPARAATATVGVDLAAEAKGTAVARVVWDAGRAVVTELRCPADDAEIVRVAHGAALVGIDCPLGWPDPFVRFVARHQEGAVGGVDTDPGWRTPLTHRTTDLACIAHTRAVLGRAVRPLSVSADLLGHTAMRSSVLLGRLADADVVIDRSGTTGQVAEVYPAATLALWQLPRRYKGANRAALPAAVDALRAAAPWLDLGAADARCRASDHCFDAVVAALAARAVQLGRATAPAFPDLGTARREGWIRLATCALADLPG